MRRIHEILTPENVYVEYELAGLGSRFAAFFIDTLIQTGLILIIALCTYFAGIDISNFKNLNSIVIASGIVLLFFVVFGYYICFEMIMFGQTPGKKAIKLRAIQQTGSPISFSASFLRNIFRIADFLPSFYILGSVMIVFTEKYKRLGDFVANTIVVKVREEKDSAFFASIQKVPESKKTAVNLNKDMQENNSETETLGKINNFPVNNEEFAILKEFVQRRTFGEKTDYMANQLNDYFIDKFKLITPYYADPYKFFEEILRQNS